MSDWRPIETAPKDGTFILAVIAGFKPAVVRFMCAPGRSDWIDSSDNWTSDIGGPFWEPTHWMPLPDSPKVKEQ